MDISKKKDEQQNVILRIRDHPSVQIFFELMFCYDISVDQFLFSEKEAEKSMQRRQPKRSGKTACG